MSVRLGEILVKESLITQDQLQKALEFQRANGGKLGSCLTRMGFISDDDITGVLSRQYGVPSINLKYYEIDPNVIKLIPQDTATRYQVIPLSRVGSVLTIAMTDPTNVFAMDDIKFMTGLMWSRWWRPKRRLGMPSRGFTEAHPPTPRNSRT